MKKIIRALAVAFFIAPLVTQSAFAGWWEESAAGASPAASGTSWEKKGEWSFVFVTEKIPGARCESVRGTDQTTRLYKCPVGSGFDTVVGALGSLIKYATYLTGLIGVLMIVLSGIQYSLSGGGEDAKKAKNRVMQLIWGLVLLFLTGLILNTVAPWIYM